jgi:hypothetical protein
MKAPCGGIADLAGGLMGLLALLRSAAWLNAERAGAWCRVLAACSALIVLGWLAASHDGLDIMGKPLGTDFVSFWTASQLVLQGRAAEVYDPAIHLAAQRALFPVGVSGIYVFVYPPVFLLFCLPLALIGFFPSLICWLAVTFAAMFLCLRRILTPRWAILPVAAFPGVLINAGNGQNGFLSAACFGACMIWLERRPFLAGLCLGGLVYKPHLLAAAPIALLAARRWAALAGAATSATGLIALSWLVLGTGVWHGFFGKTGFAVASMEQGLINFAKMQSSFATARLWQADVTLAYSLQAAVALVACALLAAGVMRRPGGALEVAMMVTASLLCTPYLFSYDLACLAVPLAWLTAQGSSGGWRDWEKLAALGAYIVPMIAVASAGHGLPAAPLAMMALLVVLARRAGRDGRERGRWITDRADP